MVSRELFDSRLWQEIAVHRAAQSSSLRQNSWVGDSWLGELCLVVGPSVC